MGKTIAQLPELAEAPAGSDTLPIYDSGVTKRVSVSNLVSALSSIADGQNVALGTTTGTKIGTSTSQKLGFWNATPVDQPAVTADLLDSLQEVGVIATGAGDTPLNLSGGAMTCGTITIGDAKDIVLNTTTGTKIGTATTQKLAFWNATPVVQPSGANQAALTNNTGGTADGTLSSIGSTNTGTDRSASLNNNFTELHVLLNEIRSALVSVGIIKGSA